MNMRKVVLVIMNCFFFLTVFSQQLSIKSVMLRPTDTRASVNPRTDSKGEKCSIVRVSVVGVKDLIFPDAIGAVEYSQNEYIVYVSSSQNYLLYKDSAGAVSGQVNFEDFGLELSPQASYDVIFETNNHLRSAIFNIQPQSAILFFDHEQIKVDSLGLAVIDKPVGVYSYHVTAEGYKEQTGQVELLEDEIKTITDVSLEEILYPVNITVQPTNATLFIDNVPYENYNRMMLQLPKGKHSLRITAQNYEDEETTINVREDGNTFDYELKSVKAEIVKHKEERSRTRNSVRNSNHFIIEGSIKGLGDIKNSEHSRSAFSFGLGASFTQPFGGVFSAREGISLGLVKAQRNENYIALSVNTENDSTCWLFYADVPLQLGISLPFGKYNQHQFNVYGGGYAALFYGIKDLREYALTDEEKKFYKGDGKNDNSEKGLGWDYGVRLTARIDFNKFAIGANIDKSFNKRGFSLGVFIGFRLFAKQK